MLTFVNCLMFLAAAGAGSLYFVASRLRKRRVGEPPIVKGSVLWGSAVDFGQNAVTFLHKARKTYGKVFTIRLINQYLTIIMDPNAYETMSSERNFDFDPIQKQVNWNVFNFVLREPKKMIKDTGRTVRGRFMQESMDHFVSNLNAACQNITDFKAPDNNSSTSPDATWATDGLRAFTASTAFDAIFNTVFGRSGDHPFNAAMAYENFEVYHKYFNHLWLGMPKACFPTATKALKHLLVMPDSEELLQRPDLSTYIRTAIEYMREQGQTEADIKGHNLVYLHVNFNTFRMAFWVLNNLLENRVAWDALYEEITDMVAGRLDGETNTASFTLEDVESMQVLESVIQETSRISSGVFMVRYIKEDTHFTMPDGDVHLMRKGDRVAIYPPAIHKDAEIFEDPLVFKYDRFIDAKFYKDGSEVKHPVMTFGSLCPGKRYALLQIKWFVLTILSRFEMQLQAGEHAEYDYHYHGHEILPPVKDVSINFRARDSFPVLKFLQR